MIHWRLFLGGFIFLLCSPILLSYGLTNWLALRNMAEWQAIPYYAPDAVAETDLLLNWADTMYPQNRSVSHQRAVLSDQVSDWQKAGWQGQDFFHWGKKSLDVGNVETAVKWLSYGLQLEEDDYGWALLGRSCQLDPFVNPLLCDAYRSRENENLFVDATFAFDSTFWRTGKFSECPPNKCATIELKEAGSVSLAQCLYVEPGVTYSYQVWLKVESTDESQWRPLYHQGRMAGQNRGFWPSMQQGSTDWTLWQTTFVAEEFDNKQACFAPVNLLGAGQVWFHSAQLRKEQP